MRLGTNVSWAVQQIAQIIQSFEFSGSWSEMDCAHDITWNTSSMRRMHTSQLHQTSMRWSSAYKLCSGRCTFLIQSLTCLDQHGCLDQQYWQDRERAAHYGMYTSRQQRRVDSIAKSVKSPGSARCSCHEFVKAAVVQQSSVCWLWAAAGLAKCWSNAPWTQHLKRSRILGSVVVV